jgi:DNA-binding MarR family transcriptional regulator
MNETGEAGLFALLHAADVAHEHVESKLAAVGLSLPKLAALRALADADGPLPLGQLAGRLSCVKSNITQLVDRLEADGFVARAPDPGDRRSRLAVMTAAGRKACEAGSRVQEETERELFGALSADERVNWLHSWPRSLPAPCELRTHMSIRAVKRISQSTPTLEGAGVHLRRAFGFGKTTEFDPFLLLDDFRNDNPDEYLAGFPWHPHRGIETITYVLAGTVDHGDSLGNRGSLGAATSSG